MFEVVNNAKIRMIKRQSLFFELTFQTTWSSLIFLFIPIYIYTYIHIHTYIYPYIYIYTYI